MRRLQFCWRRILTFTLYSLLVLFWLFCCSKSPLRQNKDDPNLDCVVAPSSLFSLFWPAAGSTGAPKNILLNLSCLAWVRAQFWGNNMHSKSCWYYLLSSLTHHCNTVTSRHVTFQSFHIQMFKRTVKSCCTKSLDYNVTLYLIIWLLNRGGPIQCVCSECI